VTSVIPKPMMQGLGRTGMGPACFRPYRGFPAQPTSFVGRKRELRDLTGLLASERLITLTGVGGVGKTRLALQLADRAQGRFAGAISFADLSPASNPADLPSLVEAALGLRGRRAGSPIELLVAGIGQHRVLLVLDNCEHVASACGDLVATLLGACRALVVLATSREPLGAEGENCLRVDPLPTAEAVQLLCERTGRDVPGDIDMHLAAKLCNRLDRLPLAIELAAARLRSMTLADILERIDSRFQLLATMAPGGQHARHSSLRAAIDWSHDLMSQPEQALFRRLAVFAGRFRLSDAEAVCGWSPLERHQVAGLVSHLVTRSMVGYDGSRYQLLQTLRDYAQDRLLNAGESHDARRRHAEHYLAVVESDPVKAPSLDRHVAAMSEVALQDDNLRAALDWFVEHRPSEYGRMVRALAPAWAYRGNVWEQRLHCRRALGLAQTPEWVRAALLLGISAQEFEGGDYEAAATACERAVEMAERVGDAAVQCDGLAWQGLIATVRGDHHKARSLLNRALAAGRAAGDGGAAATARMYQGLLALLEGDLASALTHLRDAEAGLRTARRAFLLAQVLIELGRTELACGERAGARRRLTEGLCLARDLQSPFLSAMGLEAMAALLVSEGAFERGLELGAAGKASRSALGVAMPAVYDAVIEALLGPARRRLGPQRSAQCLRRGASLPLATAVERALGGKPARVAALTRRQQEVADLVSTGLTNRDIAARLHLSVRTVEDHVESILERLGFDRRSQIAAYMTQGELAKTP
jgi:predicted ATPase/DNA-binding NarL/FixJ family response regulator